MGPMLGVPVNQLYSAAFGPGFLLAGAYIIYCLVRSFFNPKLGPRSRRRSASRHRGKLAYEFVIGIVPLACIDRR